MSLHPILAMQLADDRRATLTTAAGRRRRARPGAPDIPSPGTSAFTAWAASFADLVAGHGLGGCEPQVGALSGMARRRGMSPTVTAVLADRRQPGVARERALGRVLVTLSEPVPAHPAASDVA